MSKIFVGLDDVGAQSVSHLNGNGAVMTGEINRFPGQRVTQSTAAGVAVADETTPGTKVGSPPALEMDRATRQELTRLTHTLFLNSGGSRVVAFSGVQAGVGCSWMLVRTAELLAAADAGSVCVVDANLRSSMLHIYLHVRNSCGLSDALVAPHPVCEYVRRLGGRLHLLSSGSLALKAEPLLASSAFRACVDELRASFDFVLFDTPPLAASSDALAVASRIDGLAMVVEANYTNRETALKAAKSAAAAKVRMLGVVLNKRTYPIPTAIYKRL
ncbi:MAG TPA: CpsD/CapB family tyrosine-protein kinase [Terracidiphilus sp.]